MKKDIREEDNPKENTIFDNFDPFIFGATFWQTSLINWWYNVGRNLVKDPIGVSNYWYKVYLEGLEEICFPFLKRMKYDITTTKN